MASFWGRAPHYLSQEQEEAECISPLCFTARKRILCANKHEDPAPVAAAAAAASVVACGGWLPERIPAHLLLHTSSVGE